MQLSSEVLFLLCQCAISAAYQAGHMIRQKAGDPVSVDAKSGALSRAAQVVTEVDHLSQEIILQTLEPTCKLFDLALLSEESPDDRERLEKDYFWCVDPLDGTLPFIESLPGYAVSIALVSRFGEPVIGVIYDPYRQTLYHAIRGQGGFRNSHPLTIPSEPAHQGKPLRFLTDLSFAEDPLFDKTQQALQMIARELGYSGGELFLQGGAAINACQVIEQPPTCYFKFPKPKTGGGCLWDYAATACLFAEIGGHASDIWRQPLELNRSESTFMNHKGVMYCADTVTAEAVNQLYQQLSRD